MSGESLATRAPTSMDVYTRTTPAVALRASRFTQAAAAGSLVQASFECLRPSMTWHIF